MKRTVLVFSLMAAAAFMTACGGKGEQLAIIELEENSATDYSWDYTMSQKGIVRETARGHRKKPEDENPAGSAGSALFVFEGVAPGETELHFSYGRQRENEEPVRTAVYLLKVHQDGTITTRLAK